MYHQAVAILFLLLACQPLPGNCHAECLSEDGVVNAVGTERWNSPCTQAVCTEGGWMPILIMDCHVWPPVCVDLEYVDGQCCPICPNGPNCAYRNTIIPAGEDVIIGHKVCRCRRPRRRPGNGPSFKKAVCRRYRGHIPQQPSPLPASTTIEPPTPEELPTVTSSTQANNTSTEEV